MSVKLLTEHHFEFLGLKGGCIGSPESIHVKMPDCWKSHVTALFILIHLPGGRIDGTVTHWHFNQTCVRCFETIDNVLKY